MVGVRLDDRIFISGLLFKTLFKIGADLVFYFYLVSTFTEMVTVFAVLSSHFPVCAYRVYTASTENINGVTEW